LVNMEDFVRIFSEMITAAHQQSKDNGWWDNSASLDDHTNIGMKILLIHAELSEAVEAIRNANPPDKHLSGFNSLTVELADTIIRIMDLAGAYKLDLAEAIVKKMEYNKTRPYRHGKKF